MASLHHMPLEYPGQTLLIKHSPLRLYPSEQTLLMEHSAEAGNSMLLHKKHICCPTTEPNSFLGTPSEHEANKCENTSATFTLQS